MFDLKFIRENLKWFDDSMKNRNVEVNSASLLELDQQIKSKTHLLQELQNRRNELAKLIGAAKQSGGDAAGLMKEAEEIKAKISTFEAEINKLDSALREVLIRIPNVLASEVPIGYSEDENVVLRKFGEPRKFDFMPKEHFNLGADLGMMDFEQTAKISGSRFVTLTAGLAKLERALKNFMLDVHTQKFGYTEVTHPVLVKQNAIYGVGQYPKFLEDLFKTENGHFLISTSEAYLTNMVADTIISEEELPIRFVAYSQCYRSEAGSAGKDTRGMIRQHQFSKVELVSITTPEDSAKEHERMLNCAEEILKLLELPYQVLLLCSGDIGFTATKTYDLEVWLPGQNKYREISSCSNCLDFQARRMMARYKKHSDKKNYYAHTLNGSGLAIGRTIIAIMENYQDSEGNIKIPSVLVPYMNGLEIIKRG